MTNMFYTAIRRKNKDIDTYLLLFTLLLTGTMSIQLMRRKVSSTKDGKKPYPRFFHPRKSLLDEIISIVFELLLPLRRLASCPTNTPSDILQKIREKMNELPAMESESLLKSWNTVLTEEVMGASNTGSSLSHEVCLVNGNIDVPLDITILQDWGIVSSDAMNKVLTSDKGTSRPVVKVDIICPSALIAPGKLQGVQKSEKHGGYHSLQHGSLSLSDLDVSMIEKHDIPILIWFHGGGMTVGQATKDSYALKMIQKLVELRTRTSPQIDGPDSMPSSYFICLSVEYSLAPEDPFPAAVIDCLSVTSAVLRSLPNSMIHIGGISAGGNLAAVTAFEAYRKHPGRIKSCAIIDPMCIPHVNTTSSFMNQVADGLCPVEFLRWAWKAYLCLDENRETTHERNLKTDAESNVKDVEECKWMTQEELKSFQRLFSPQLDLPPGISTDEKAPTIIIHTSSADVLRDDGLVLIDSLKSKAGECRNVHSFEGKGSHCLSLDLDKETTAAMMDVWYQAIYE